MNTKSLTGVKVKDTGEIEAVFATLNVIDHHKDVTLPGAFTDGAEVRISAFNHASWGHALPVGKGTIHEEGDRAVLRGKFFLDTEAGRETFAVVKAMGELQEWSYGYDTEKMSFGKFMDEDVRFLEKQNVTEVSPVLQGAGIGTRTLVTKGRGPAPTPPPGGLVPAVKGALAVHDTPVLDRPWDGAKTLDAIPDDARPRELRSMHAWVDPDGDPEHKTSYRFPHHHGVDGPANLRACLMHIAVLNGAKGDVGLSDTDRAAVHDHLASHLRDADRDVPELRTAGDATSKSRKFADEVADVMAAVSALTDRATDVLALRARKGKGMSPATANLLSWVRDDLKRLDALLSHPIQADGTAEPTEDELASLMLASVAALTRTQEIQ